MADSAWLSVRLEAVGRNNRGTRDLCRSRVLAQSGPPGRDVHDRCGTDSGWFRSGKPADTYRRRVGIGRIEDRSRILPQLGLLGRQAGYRAAGGWSPAGLYLPMVSIVTSALA